MTKSTPFPTYTQWLAEQSPEFLRSLLAQRPDVISPPPRSSEVLAARLQLRASVLRIVPTLPPLPLAIIEAAAELGAELEPVAVTELISFLKKRCKDSGRSQSALPTTAHIRAGLDTLRELALIWGNGTARSGKFASASGRASKTKSSGNDVTAHADQFRLVDEVTSALPMGWEILPDPQQRPAAELHEALTQVDRKQKRLLDTLVQAGGLGTTKDAAADADPVLPVPRLIASGLLQRVDDSTVALPDVVRALLRGQWVPTDELSLRPFAAETSPLAKGNDRAAGSAWETIRRINSLLELLGHHPAATLKGGVIGVRETRRLEEELALNQQELAEIIALASAARLIHVGTPHPLPENDNGGDYLAPTLEADSYLQADLGYKWVSLVLSLNSSDGAPWLVGDEGDDGKAIPLLSHRARMSSLPRIRELVLSTLAEYSEPETPPSPDAAVVSVLDFRRAFANRFPLMSARTSDRTLESLLSVTSSLGLTIHSGSLASGTFSAGLTYIGQLLLTYRAPEDSADGQTSAAESKQLSAAPAELHEKFAKLLPPSAPGIMVQADHTIVVPGPPTPQVEAMLKTIADLESAGLASVYRITEASLERALDSGTATAEIRSFLVDNALGEVPQSVSYLLDDVARRHGRLRSGAAASFIRCDDTALLLNLANSPVGVELGLRQIADTVLISQAPLVQVVEKAKAHGFSLVAEDALGLALDLSPDPSRIHSPAPTQRHTSYSADAQRIDAALTAIFNGDRADTTSGTTKVDITDDRATGTAAYSLLQRASRAGRDVTIAYVDRNGQAGRRKVRPVTVSGGQVDAIDPASGEVLRFLLHRVTEVILDD